MTVYFTWYSKLITISVAITVRIIMSTQKYINNETDFIQNYSFRKEIIVFPHNNDIIYIIRKLSIRIKKDER